MHEVQRICWAEGFARACRSAPCARWMSPRRRCRGHGPLLQLERAVPSTCRSTPARPALVKDDLTMSCTVSPLRPPLPSKGHASLRRGRVSETGRVYFLTFTVRDRRPVFSDPCAATIMSGALSDELLAAGNRINAWVVMPDHVHLLMELSGADDLSVAVARIKSGSSRRVNAYMGRAGALWASGYHDHALRKEEAIESVVDYILANPVRAGLVEHSCDYRFSWSREL